MADKTGRQALAPPNAATAEAKFHHCGKNLFWYLRCSFFTDHFTGKNFMSQHRSLRAATTLGGKRNVLKRFERVELLKKRGQWKDGDRITGLRKTKPGV
jgi:small basic protein (TIGR04137 family)